MRSRSVASSRKDAFVRKIAELVDASEKTQRQIALEIGYDQPNLVSMFKKDQMRVPLEKLPALAFSLGADPATLVRLWLANYEPEIMVVIERAMERIATEKERTWIDALRRDFGHDVPIFDDRQCAIIHLDSA